MQGGIQSLLTLKIPGNIKQTLLSFATTHLSLIPAVSFDHITKEKSYRLNVLLH